jgi:demethylspheroidene O-methyltransferase
MAGTPGATAMGDGYFGLYLWAMNSGRPRTAAEYGTMLESAGFSHWRRAATNLPAIASVVVSTK